MINENYKFSELTGKIIDCAITIHNTLKSGLPEIYYHRAMIIELALQQIPHKSEVTLSYKVCKLI